MSLYSVELRNDPRVAEAKALLRAALEEHQVKLQHQSAQEAQSQAHEEALQNFAELRGAPLFYPHVASGLGHGALVECVDGSVKYDFISGIGVHQWGHSNTELLDACVDAALSDTVMQGNLQQSIEAVELMKLMCDCANQYGAHLERVFLTSSGAMANENALKIIFQHKAPANRLLAFEHCFAGRTLGMAWVTDKALYRDGIPQTLQCDYVPFFDHNNPEESTARSVAVLEQHLQRYPQQHAAFFMELIQGEGGYYSAPAEYFRTLAECCKRNNILVHIDEVQSFCRLETPYAFQYFGLDDVTDTVAVGKASQVCATLYRPNLQPRPGLISQTFTSSASAIFSALHIFRDIMNGDLFGGNGRIAAMGNYFREGLMHMADELPDLVSGPYGLGAMVAFTPADGERTAVIALSKALYDAGVLSFVAGNAPTRLRFLIPAAVVTKDDIDAVLKVVKTVLMCHYNGLGAE